MRTMPTLLGALLNENPILDTRKYVVEFEDDKEADFAANTLSKSMYAQCD